MVAGNPVNMEVYCRERICKLWWMYTDYYAAVRIQERDTAPTTQVDLRKTALRDKSRHRVKSTAQPYALV